MTSTSEETVTGDPVTLSVKEMMCAEGCGTRVKELLAGTPGVKKATVDFETKQAHLVVEPGSFDPAAATATLAKAGYPAEVVSPAK